MRLRSIAPRPKQVLLGLLAAILIAGGLAGYAYARTTIPSPSTIATAQTTTIYYANGHRVLARLGSTNRTDVPLSQVPPKVRFAVLSAEDRHFYSEPGISPTGIVRALLVDLKGGDISQGGSTITQQYVKNAYLSPKRTLTRKLDEILIASKLGQTRSKNSILDDYLNTIYYGRNAYGIAAAAKAYFNEDVSELTVSQGALLAAVIRGPSLYDPRPTTNLARSQARWHYVIDGMVSQGWLTQAQASAASFPSTSKTASTALANCHKTSCYIRDDVEHELVADDGLSQDQLDLGGYNIYTTINYKDEKALIAAEKAVLPKNNRGTPESGAASIVPGNGAIDALYGGHRYCHQPKKNKDACIDLSGYTGQWARPAGSSFKAFTLLTALKQGISLNSTFDGPYQVTVDGDTIHNSSPGEACYGCTLVKAFAESINTIFVPLAKQVNPAKVVQTAYAAGIPESRKLGAFPDIALGPDSVSPVDLANAYATVAANGVEATPYLVKSVETTGGQTIYQHKPQLTKNALPSDVTSDAIYAMTKVLQPGGTAYGHALTGRPSAGKTGTTDANTNAWFTGFTPQLCTSVWIGNVNPKQTVSTGGVGEVFGGTLPAEIWQQSMNAMLAGAPVDPFPTPSDIGTIEHSGSPTSTPTATATSTATATATATPTHTAPTHPTSTPTVSPTISPTVSPTITPTITPTRTRRAGVTRSEQRHRHRSR